MDPATPFCSAVFCMLNGILDPIQIFKNCVLILCGVKSYSEYVTDRLCSVVVLSEHDPLLLALLILS